MDKIKKYFINIINILSKKELSILPSYLAYSLVLAIIPIITCLVVIIIPFGIEITDIVSLIKEIFPTNASNLIIDTITGDSFDLSIGLLNITTFLIAAKGMYAIVKASNDLYKIKSTSKVRDYFRSFLILIIMILLLAFLIIVPLLGDNIINLINNINLSNNIIDMINLVYNLMKWPITLLLIFIAVKLIYIIAPSVKITGKDTTLGSFITTLGWAIFTAIFSYYINYFGRYDIVYGSLSNLIILLIWFYVLSYILLLGIVINTLKVDDKRQEN